MLTFLTVVNLLNYLDRYIAHGVVSRIIDDLHITNQQGGYFLSASVIGYVIFSPFFGYLGDRWHRGKLMGVGVFLWSIATVFAGTANTFSALVLSRVFVGIGESSFGTISPGYLKDKYKDPAKLNMALSIFFCAIPVGSALGYVCAGQIASLLSWHYAFFICGLPGIFLAVALFKIPETRIAPTKHEPVMQGLSAILRNRLLLFAIGGYVLNSFALNCVAGFITKYGEKELGFTLGSITFYFGIILVGTGIIGTLCGGKIASMLAKDSKTPLCTMLRFIGITSLLGLPFLVSAFLVEQQFLFLALCTFAEILIFASTGPINSIIVQTAPNGFTTLTQGITIFALNFFGALPAPILVGAVADHYSLALGMQLASIALLLSGAIWVYGAKYSHE